LDDTAEGQIKRRIIYLLMCSLAKATLGFNTDDSRKLVRKFNNTFSISLDEYIGELAQ